MSTTTLAVELLVIGYQALIWLGLAICLSPALCNDTILQTMKDWKELTFVASVVTAYTAGAIMNGIASRLMGPFEGIIYKNRPQKPSELRATILIEKPEAFGQVMKNFDVPRVLRSTIFNIFLIGLLSFIHFYSINATSSQLLFILTASILGTAGAAWAWYETADNYFVHLTRTYDALKKIDAKVKPTKK